MPIPLTNANAIAVCTVSDISALSLLQKSELPVLCPKGDTNKQINKHIDQRCGGANRRQRLTSGKAPHYNNIYCIKQQLKNPR